MKRMVRLALFILLAAAAGMAPAGPPPVAKGPREEGLAVFRILQRQDWVALYSVTAFSERVVEDLPANPKEFALGVQRGIGGAKDIVDQMFGGMSDMAVGEADIRGDYATLPTSCIITVQGKKHAFAGTAHMIRRQHTWKWDLTFSDNAEEATAKALTEMLGKPTAEPVPGK